MFLFLPLTTLFFKRTKEKKFKNLRILPKISPNCSVFTRRAVILDGMGKWKWEKEKKEKKLRF